MKKLLTLLFTFSILYSPYSHSNILDDLLGNMSPSDVKIYDKSYIACGSEVELYKLFPCIWFEAKLKNLNQEKSIKEVHIEIETLDCKKGCKDCITADIGVYEVLASVYFGNLRPNTVFQAKTQIRDETRKGTYVQASGNETCLRASIDKVKGFHIFE